MQKEHEQHQSNLAKGHGQYLQIDETEFIKVMTNSHHVVCHFYHHDFDRCKIIDMHLGRLCRKYTKCKFVSVDAERCPFFSQKLQIQTLPTVVMFEDGVAIDRIMGFEEIGNVRTPTSCNCTLLTASKLHALAASDLPSYLTRSPRLCLPLVSRRARTCSQRQLLGLESGRPGLLNTSTTLTIPSSTT